METKRIGAQTLRFSRPPRVESFANIGAKLEGQGPLADYFDELSEDHFFGEKTWEKGVEDTKTVCDEASKTNSAETTIKITTRE